MDKKSVKYEPKEFKDKKYLYSYVCGLVLENSKEELRQINIIIDKSGNPKFRNSLSKYLKNKINVNQSVIRSIKMQRSESNNLLQLADYIAGIISKSVMNQKGKSDEYRKVLKFKESSVEII